MGNSMKSSVPAGVSEQQGGGSKVTKGESKSSAPRSRLLPKVTSICEKDYKFSKKLGEGAYSVVWLAKHTVCNHLIISFFNVALFTNH